MTETADRLRDDRHVSDGVAAMLIGMLFGAVRGWLSPRRPASVPAPRVSDCADEPVRTTTASAKGRAFPRGKGAKGTWASVGPSQALYPKTQFRNSFSYVPTDYVAGRPPGQACSPWQDAA